MFGVEELMIDYTQQEHLVSEFAVHQVKFVHKPSQDNP